MENSKSSLKDRLCEAMTLRGKKAVDLTRDLKIPKSAISQYLSGKSQSMDSERLYAIAKYLDVDEPWLLGFDVPIKSTTDIKKEQPTEIDGLSKDLKELIESVKDLPEDKIQMLLQVAKSIK